MLATIDHEGRVVNQGSRSLFQPFYKEVLEEFLDCVSRLPEAPLSVYVRGSISVGKAIEGLSDADLVVVYDHDATEGLRKSYSAMASQLAGKYKGRLDEVDVTLTTREALLYDAQIKNLKIYLKYQSVLLDGRDILDQLPEVYPGRNLALYMYGDLSEEILSLKRQFEGIGAPKLYQKYERETQFWCVWLARVVLRSGMALAMTRRPLFTQDLLECRDLIVEFFPELAEMASLAIDFAINPTDDARECIDFIDMYVDNYLKLWRIEKEMNDAYYK